MVGYESRKSSVELLITLMKLDWKYREAGWMNSSLSYNFDVWKWMLPMRLKLLTHTYHSIRAHLIPVTFTTECVPSDHQRHFCTSSPFVNVQQQCQKPRFNHYPKQPCMRKQSSKFDSHPHALVRNFLPSFLTKTRMEFTDMTCCKKLTSGDTEMHTAPMIAEAIPVQP